MAETSEVQLEFRLRPNKKDKFLRSIFRLKNSTGKFNKPEYYDRYIVALQEAAVFHYPAINENRAVAMVDMMLGMADEELLSGIINKLWTGTVQKESTDYHKALYLVITGFAVDHDLGEFVGQDPVTDMFKKARETKERPVQPRTTSAAYKRR